ncbi:MAG: CRISPR-associated protein Cas4 [Sporomusaceae bacterium]|nr:CRISPR-associated protein Cas4 [Sporomusaceae bacterium]
MDSIPEDDFLMLSGIQHMAFCERQWALIHVEQLWAENVRTVEGAQLHERTDDPFEDETRKTLRTVRAMPLVSRRLGLRGIADVVEFYQAEAEIEGQGCRLAGRRGWWRPVPVEYKRGRPKRDDRDAVQLCAQAMALEEMLNITIASGFLFYWQTKHRQEILLDAALRQQTIELAGRMHQFVQEGRTPPAPKGKRCKECSLIEQCQPKWSNKQRSVRLYLQRMSRMEEDGV